MSLLGNIKGKIDQMGRDRKLAKDKAERAQYSAETRMLKKKRRYLPVIQKYAHRHGVSVEALDTAAYVYKTENGKTRGIHIDYGTGPATINRKIEIAFTKKASSSKILKGITNAAHKAKAIREELGEAGEAVKGAMGDGKGNMFEDPNFGGNFAGSGSRSSSSGKKRKPARQSNSNSIYPDMKF
jgi:hypothetical protein